MSPRRPRQRDEAHLRWIRTLPCCITGRTDGVEAAHIRYADPKWGKRHTGKGEKPSDMYVIPLHHEQHRQQHTMNEKVFWSRYRHDPLGTALALWSVSGDSEIGELILSERRSS